MHAEPVHARLPVEASRQHSRHAAQQQTPQQSIEYYAIRAIVIITHG